jgi:hypothetical protein
MGMAEDLKRQTCEELQSLCARMGQKAFLGKYIFSFIHTKGVGSIDEVTPLPAAFRKELAKDYYIVGLGAVGRFEDPDGTVKYLFELADRVGGADGRGAADAVPFYAVRLLAEVQVLRDGISGAYPEPDGWGDSGPGHHGDKGYGADKQRGVYGDGRAVR